MYFSTKERKEHKGRKCFLNNRKKDMNKTQTTIYAKILAVFFFMVGIAHCDNAPYSPPTINLPPPCPPVVIDGRLDDAGWQTAFATRDFSVFKRPDVAADDTAMMLAADNQWLYIAFECAHPDPAGMRANVLLNNTGGVFGDECVKVFISPGAKNPQYFRFVLNTANAHDFTKNATPSGQWPVDPPWPAAAAAGEHGWTAEIAVPLAYLEAYGGAAPFRISAFRHKVVKQIEAEVVAGEMETYACWPAHKEKWLEYENLAQVGGINPGQITMPFMAAVSDTDVSRYHAAGTGLCYGVRMQLHAFGNATGAVSVSVLDQPAAGAAREFARDIFIAGPADLELEVPVANADSRNVAIRLRSAGSLLEYYTIPDTGLLTLLRFYADRSYYTGEACARLIGSIGLDPGELKNYSLRAELRGQVIASMNGPPPQCALPVDAHKLDLGVNSLEVGLWDANGTKLAAQPVGLIKLAPKPGHEVKIDREARIILRDGAPYFPLGFLWDAPAAELRALGYDAVATAGHQFNSSNDLDKVAPLLTDAASNNVHVVLRADTWGAPVDTLPALERHFAPEAIKKILYPAPNTPNSLLMRKYWARKDVFAHLPRQERTAIYRDYFETVRPLIAGTIGIAADHGNVLAYMNIDEPGRADLRYYDILEVCREIYDMAQALDPYRPVMCLFPSVIPNNREALEIADIIITDPYWIPGRPGDNKINHVSKIVALQDRRCAPERKVCMVAPLASWWSMTHKRALSQKEIVCQTYLALIHGAKGLMFWRYNYVVHREQWDAYARLSREIREISPALLAPRVFQEIHYDPVEFDPDKDRFPAVQVRLFYSVRTGYLLLAANSMNYPVKAHFTVAGLSGKARCLSGAAELEVASEGFAETFEPLGVRAYRLENMQPASDKEAFRDEGVPAPNRNKALPACQPISIRVAMEADTSNYQPEIAVSSRGRPGKRNILINPSFEENTLPLWPDYYRIGKTAPPIGHPDAPWTLSEDNPFHGRYCLRIKGNRQFRFNLAPLEPAPADYVFSVYIRTDRPRAPVWFSICGKTHTLQAGGNGWQRYSFPVKVPPNADEKLSSRIQPVSEDGTVWLDAMQFEKGTSPTGFEP